MSYDAKWLELRLDTVAEDLESILKSIELLPAGGTEKLVTMAMSKQTRTYLTDIKVFCKAMERMQEVSL